MSDGQREQNKIFTQSQSQPHPADHIMQQMMEDELAQQYESHQQTQQQQAQQRPQPQPQPQPQQRPQQHYAAPGQTRQVLGGPEVGHDDDLGFVIPVDNVPLPSRGLVYDQKSALHKLEWVAIKAMTAREEDILTSKAFLKNGTVISHLLRSCIATPGINPVEMLSGDRTALLVALRITGYGPDYVIATQCPACQHKQDYEFDLRQLPVKMLELEPLMPFANRFNVSLPVSKKNITFRFMTGADEEQLQLEQAMKKKKIKTQLDNIVTSRYLKQIVAVDGREDKGYINRFIQNMPARDSRFLRSYIEKHDPGMEMKGVMLCEECGEGSEVDVPIQASFFWPDV